MNKKAFFVLLSAILITYLIYRAVINVINTSVDDANKRGVEEYAETIKLIYAESLLTGENITSIDDMDIKISIKVECKEKSIDENGVIVLKGCTVENSKRTYSYVNNKVEVE